MLLNMKVVARARASLICVSIRNAGSGGVSASSTADEDIKRPSSNWREPGAVSPEKVRSPLSTVVGCKVRCNSWLKSSLDPSAVLPSSAGCWFESKSLGSSEEDIVVKCSAGKQSNKRLGDTADKL